MKNIIRIISFKFERYIINIKSKGILIAFITLLLFKFSSIISNLADLKNKSNFPYPFVFIVLVK